MTLRAKIRIFQWIAVVSILLMTAVAGWSVTRSTADQARIEAAYERFIGILTLSKLANRYSEQIAELVLLGEEALPDYLHAKEELNKTFAMLDFQVAGDGFLVEGELDGSCGFCEGSRLEGIRALFHEIELAVDSLIGLKQQGRREEAVELFRTTIEKGFDAEVELLLSEARSTEQQSVLETRRRAAAMRQRVLAFFAVVVLVIMLTAAATGLLIRRGLIGPIARLSEGVRVIGSGDLEHRIPDAGRDELSGVAKRVNEMAVQLREQRDELLRIHASLEAEVRERTSEVLQANERLVELDRHRSALLADIGHELRTPLTVLRGEAEIALRGDEKSPPVYRESLELIQRKCEDLTRLVDDLLFLARAEGDAIRFDQRCVRLHDILENIVQEAEILARRQHKEVAAHLPREEILIDADPHRLHQAVMVLVVNAIEHGVEGSRVEIAASASEESVSVRIADEGKGIPREEIPYVFERFYRGKGSGRLEKQAGSGLGLPIAKWIVEKHQGTLTLDSDPDGTVFTLSLPRLTVGRA